MNSLIKKFVTVSEDLPGDKWLKFFELTKDSYLNWYVKGVTSSTPSLAECQEALKEHMPELYTLWEKLVLITGADETTAKMLSMYCPTAYERGCSQAVWSKQSPILVRNYDYSPDLFEGRILKSSWFGNKVICTTDSLWGALDGMNDQGLCVSLAYGGSSAVAKGFGITLILRYILEFCSSTAEAIEALSRIPVNMSYNITLIDSLYHVKTIELSPISSPVVTSRPFAVNKQGDFDLSSYAMFSNSAEREQVISELLFDPLTNIESFVNAFFYAPLFTQDYDNNLGTLYTAIYNPLLRASEYRWLNGVRIYQSFDHFTEQEYYIQLK